MAVDTSGFAFYLDSNLTSPLESDLLSSQKSDGSSDPNDFQLFLGSPDSGYQLREETNPGVNNIVLSVVDDAPATGHTAAEIKLATTQGGLDSAVGGDPLTVGLQVLGGVVNAYEFWIRVDDATLTKGFSNELSVVINSVIGTPI